MIVSYYTEIDDLWSNEVFESKLSELPIMVRQHILEYTQPHNRQLRICGKLLLLKILKDFYPDTLYPLDNLRYDSLGKPFLHKGFDFSIAHSGNIAICAATDKGDIGIDLEIVKETDLSLFQAYFTPAEWDKINTGSQLLERFYTMWVRKEAVIKAIGKGIHSPLLSVDVCNDSVNYEGNTFYLHELQIHLGYKAAIATTEAGEAISVNAILM